MSVQTTVSLADDHNVVRDGLKMLVSGKTKREISKLLVISIKTVDKHQQNIIKKLNIHAVAGLRRDAIENDIV
ncbi:MAG: LuxR C-terminal-related transcriptional regulator [Candidatus Marinimicrobia bacterium]|nr:LuxR C-terminal-related transcriptional regulator [Candidatus Neomarinimicrobiota bacterium]